MQDVEGFIRGFGRLQQQYLSEPALRDSLRSGQHPATLVIGCCDSGVDPGDIFVVRNIANLVPPCAPPGVTSAIEFAVCVHDKHEEGRCRAAELTSILHSPDKLLSYPWIRRRLEDGKLALDGWYFDIDTGSLLAYSARKQEFLNLAQPLDAAA